MLSRQEEETQEDAISGKSDIQYWDENWNQPRVNSNLKNSVNYYKVKDFQPHAIQNFSQDVGIPPSPESKRKKSGASDPRFKRVINTEERNNNEVFNAEKIIANITRALEDRMNNETGLTDKVISYLKAPSETPFYSGESIKAFQNERDVEAERGCRQDLTEIATRDVGFASRIQCSVKGSKAKSEFNRNRNFDHFDDTINNTKCSSLKRSASDCTLNTKGEEQEVDDVHVIKSYPSASKLNKVHNWMNDCKLPAEKRRSVITVIGQTQTKPFSKILNEINQRRKLAKELDKHALCKAIMESAENKADVKNLIAQVDFVLPDGKVIYSTEKVLLHGENNRYKIDREGEEKKLAALDAEDKLRKRYEMIPERDSSTQVGKRSKTKRQNRKLGSSAQEKVSLQNAEDKRTYEEGRDDEFCKHAGKERIKRQAKAFHFLSIFPENKKVLRKQ
ncbi:hypothetical protein RUM44_011434 [Polyplax serrata]|uniref:Uncharacterized protein n=1 Tax=Polyplax serrata TaxID=468196 RepID=A0ABR1AQ45_POLSC